MADEPIDTALQTLDDIAGLDSDALELIGINDGANALRYVQKMALDAARQIRATLKELA